VGEWEEETRIDNNLYLIIETVRKRFSKKLLKNYRRILNKDLERFLLI